MRVRALAKGFYHSTPIDFDDVFTLSDPSHFSPRWMTREPDSTPATKGLVGSGPSGSPGYTGPTPNLPDHKPAVDGPAPRMPRE